MWRILGNLLSTFATWTYSHPFWTLYRFRSNNRLKKLEDALVKTSATTRWHCLHLGSPQKERVKKNKNILLPLFLHFFYTCWKKSGMWLAHNHQHHRRYQRYHHQYQWCHHFWQKHHHHRNHHLWNIFFPKGGMELSFIVAIDFTASNGDPALVKIIRIHVFDDDY